MLVLGAGGRVSVVRLWIWEVGCRDPCRGPVANARIWYSCELPGVGARCQVTDFGF